MAQPTLFNRTAGIIQSKSERTGTSSEFSRQSNLEGTATITSGRQDAGLVMQIVTLPMTIFYWYISTLKSIPNKIRYAQHYVLMEYQTKVLEYPFRYTIPAFLSWKISQFVVPYGIWCKLVMKFGTDEQRQVLFSGGNSEETSQQATLECLNAQLTKLTEEKNALLDASTQNRELRALNEELGRRLNTYDERPPVG